MLQERINELSSGIVEVLENKVRVTGFMSERMMHSCLNNGKRNWSSIGLYDKEDLVFHNIKNDALFIVKENDLVVSQHQYTPVHKGTIRFKNDEGKSSSFAYTVRKSSYSDQYHFSSERDSALFNSMENLVAYLFITYGVELEGDQI